MTKADLKQTELDFGLEPAKKKKSSPAKPATEIMKTVASKSKNFEDMKRVFSDEELKEIELRRSAGQSIDSAEAAALRVKYREIKRWVLDKEKTNQSQVIMFPCLTNGTGWYKAVEFSALYYVYRLADRMGRIPLLVFFWKYLA